LLDAFIIDRIQREREATKGAFVPLRVEVPPPPSQAEPPEAERDDVGSHGVAEIDFSL
jgi:hypothetical protein